MIDERVMKISNKTTVFRNALETKIIYEEFSVCFFSFKPPIIIF